LYPSKTVALEDYRRKRDFTKSPEPSGDAPVKKKSKRDELFFCVQKHLASHLHYDLRLEWNGVLLSWAVPKGPSIDPRDKRLAMHVEDHPIDYGMFEGVIPEGYGAGIVMLWDYGTWEPESDDVDAALRKGDLKFRLNGFKLKGSWVLVKTHGYGGAPNSWLVIKHRDDWAGPIDITEFAPLSVKTPNADFAEILSDKTPDLWLSNAPAKGGDTGQMFKKIIERALSMKAPTPSNTKDTKDTKTRTGITKAKAAKAKSKTATAKSKTAKNAAIKPTARK
jgi:bifunctional non-homologous end joining protein LigD